MRTFSALFALVLGEFMLAFAQPGQWFSRAPMPTPRQETTPAVLNGRIYLPGGFNASAQAVTTVEAYDPAANTWSTPPPLPEILHHYGLATVGSRLYLLGGYTGNSFTPTNRAYVFIPDSNLWRRIANMPVARGAHSAVEFNGRIYLFGGITSLGDSRRTDMYNPQTDTYTNLAHMPTPREHLAAARIDSLIYVVGGRIGATNNNVLEAYSPATNQWYTKTPMPTARGGLAASAMRGRLYVCGGEIPGVFPQNEEYDPATDTWRTMRPMLTPRHGTGAVTVGDSVYVIGGATLQGFGVSGANEFFTLANTSQVDDDRTQPSSFVLHQNFPNPFNSSTTIEYQLPRATPVKLTVVNVLGHEVRTLLNTEQSAGRYRVPFDADELPSGMYLYRIHTRNFTSSRKMLLLR